MVNRTNIQYTIEMLRETQRPFNMTSFVEGANGGFGPSTIEGIAPLRHCNTPACIAGHIALAFPDELAQTGDIAEVCQKFLGLDEDQAYDLFTGMWSKKPMHLITLDEAITELQRLQEESYSAQVRAGLA